MQVVVTGASGNVGTSLLARLVADPAIDRIVAICRRPPDLDLPKVAWRQADVGVDRLEPLFDGSDAVVHLAWAIQPSRDEAGLERTNLVGTRRVLDAVLRTGVPTLVHASSVGAYARGPKDRPVDESWPATGVPTSLYSRHKARAEAILTAASAGRPDVRIVRLRTALVFKAAAGAEIARLFLGPLVPSALIGRRGLPLSPTFDRLHFQVVHGDDVAAAYHAALRAPASAVFNIAAPPLLGPDDLARALDARPVAIPPRLLRLAAAATWRARLHPTDPGWVDLALDVPAMDTTAATEVLGWRPHWSATEALDDLLRGLAQRTGMATAPLRPGRGGALIPVLPHRSSVPGPPRRALAAGGSRAVVGGQR